MKLTKNQLKGWIKEELQEFLSEEGEDKKPEGGGPKDAKTDIMDNPFDEEEKDEVEESVSRKRTTVKEVRKWMKTLEENRYRKIVNADARRVSWLVNNNLAEDYDQMPISMKKKWPKAAYKRERFLAKEFVKHLKSKQMNENKLRSLIRNVIIKEIRG